MLILETIVPLRGIIVKYPSLLSFSTASLIGVLLMFSSLASFLSSIKSPGFKLHNIISFF